MGLFSASLTFAPHAASEVVLAAKKSSKGRKGKTEVYAPPMSEFDMLRTKLGKVEREEIEVIEGPSVVFVTNGEGKMKAGEEIFDLNEGCIFFVGQGVKTDLEATGPDELEVWRAFAE